MPRDAWQMLQDNPKSVLIDVRSEMEFLFIGHPIGAIHISWIDGPDWLENPNFVREVRKVVLGGIIDDHNDQQHPVESAPILLICRSGARSLEAGKALVTAGFKHVYNVLEGFEGALDNAHHRSSLGGWRFHGLPWEQC
jgi:rhodanese-related sulfurtransferase